MLSLSSCCCETNQESKKRQKKNQWKSTGILVVSGFWKVLEWNENKKKIKGKNVHKALGLESP